MSDIRLEQSQDETMSLQPLAPCTNTYVSASAGSNDTEKASLPASGAASPVQGVAHPTGDDGSRIHYNTMTWWEGGLLMLAETISLGILSLPWAIAKLGLVPGLLLINFLGLLATYNGYVIGEFYLVHPAIKSMADAGYILFGNSRIAREVFGFAQVMVLVFIMAAHVTSFVIMMNVLTTHASCSIVFSLVGLAISFLLSLPRTMKGVAHLSVLSSISVLAAVIIVMVSVARLNPSGGNKGVKVFAVTNASFTTAFTGVLNIILAYAGHVAYIGFCTEFKDPRDFKYALFMQQGIAMAMYSVVGGFIYWYAGSAVPSPALEAAPPLVAKIAFGVASLTIVVAGVVNGHVACKYLYTRFCAEEVRTQKSVKSIGIWVGIVAISWLAAWLLAESIPSFPHMLGIVSALFSGWFSYGVSGMFWLHMNWGKLFLNRQKSFLTCLNSSIIMLGLVICVLGLYSTGSELALGMGGKPFSCQDTGSPQNRTRIDGILPKSGHY